MVAIPFGLALGLPITLPLPAEIVQRILAPIDVDAQFGANPDIDVSTATSVR